MSLPLPPKSTITCNEATARSVSDMLTSVIAGHAQAITTYVFYEELDNWLGPWGEKGYPIAYGKFYNVAFTTNRKLMSSPHTKEWVWKTTILLQEALRDYVVNKIRDCTIGSLTEKEMRAAAFDSHPAAYDMGGLSLLCLTAPELIPIIATIPGREFIPGSDNFKATLQQVLMTLSRITPQIIGNSMGSMAGPAHTGIFRRAMDRDKQEMRDFTSLARELTDIKSLLELGELDYIPILDRVISSLNKRQFPDQNFAAVARDIVSKAQTRRQFLQMATNNLLLMSPEVQERVRSKFPNFFRPPVK